MQHENALKVLEIKLEECNRELKQTEADVEKHRNIVGHGRKRINDLEEVIYNLTHTIKYLKQEE